MPKKGGEGKKKPMGWPSQVLPPRPLAYLALNKTLFTGIGRASGKGVGGRTYPLHWDRLGKWQRSRGKTQARLSRISSRCLQALAYLVMELKSVKRSGQK